MVSPWLFIGSVTITKYPGDLPTPVLIAPHNHEISYPLTLAAGELAEAMGTLLNGTEVLDWEYFESAWNELAAEIAAHMLLCVCKHVLPRPSDTTRVVIELNVRREIGGVFLKLLRGAAIVESVEHSGVKRRNSVKQRVGSLFCPWFIV